LEQAKATGLYDHDRLGNSEINRNLVAGASEKQLQAILDHDDLSKEDRDFVKKALAAKSGASEFSGSGQFEEKELNAYERKMQRIEGKKSRQKGDQINQLSAEERAERDRARTVVIAANAGGKRKRGDRMRERNTVAPLPVATRDSSSSAAALAANSN